MLTPGELQVGMFVTVLKNEPYKHEQFSNEISTLLSEETPTGNLMVKYNEDRSGYGSVLQIKAIQLPFVVTIEPDNHFFSTHPMKWDIRRTTFMELKPEYIEAMKKTK